MQHFFQDGFSKKDSIQPNSNFQVVCLFQGEVDQLVCWKPTSTSLCPAKPSTTLQPVSPVRGFHRERRGWPWHSFLDWKKQCPMILNLRTFEGWRFFRWNNLKLINLAVGSLRFFLDCWVKFVNASRFHHVCFLLARLPTLLFVVFLMETFHRNAVLVSTQKWRQAIRLRLHWVNTLHDKKTKTSKENHEVFLLIQRFILNIQTTQDETIQTKTIETKKGTTIRSKQ